MNVAMLSYDTFHHKGVLVLQGFHAVFRRSVEDVLRMMKRTGYRLSDDPDSEDTLTTYMFEYVMPMKAIPPIPEADPVDNSDKATLYCFDDGTGAFHSIAMNLEYVGDHDAMFDMLSATGWSIFKPGDVSYTPKKGETVYHLFRERAGA
jgi:hypothetical protein